MIDDNAFLWLCGLVSWMSISCCSSSGVGRGKGEMWFEVCVHCMVCLCMVSGLLCWRVDRMDE
ncbi:hypothetical protein V8E51_013132 [Hyaloscypha variabilis]